MTGHLARATRSPTDEAALGAARSVCDALLVALGDNLRAVYLHGSAVLGGYRSDRSDLDILAVTERDLADGDPEAVVSALVGVAYPCRGLEMTLLTMAEAARPDAHAPRFQLHVATGGRGDAIRAVDGRNREGDPDLVLHFAVCRAAGATLVGPPPEATLAPVSDPALSQAMLAEVAWASGASPEYLVLTSARAWLFAATGRLASKIDAGEWAAERYPWPEVIESALAVQRGGEAAVDQAAAGELARYVNGVIRHPDPARRPPRTVGDPG